MPVTVLPSSMTEQSNLQTISLVDMLQVAKRAPRSAWSVLILFHHGVVVSGNTVRHLQSHISPSRLKHDISRTVLKDLVSHSASRLLLSVWSCASALLVRVDMSGEERVLRCTVGRYLPASCSTSFFMDATGGYPGGVQYSPFSFT